MAEINHAPDAIWAPGGSSGVFGVERKRGKLLFLHLLLIVYLFTFCFPLKV